MKLPVRKTQSDTVDLFLMDCVIGTMDKSRATRNTELYKIYLLWCSYTSHKPISLIGFGRRLGARYQKKLVDGYTYSMCELTDRIMGRENDNFKGTI